MVSSSGRFVITYNGEIYNHLNIRKEIETINSNIKWKSTTDTETLLEALEIWGVEKTLKKIVSMFAFAIWDNSEEGPQVNYAGWIGGSGSAGYTADVMLTDADFNDIGAEYPAGTEVAYVQVYDSDVSGSIEVTFSTETDLEGEVVTLVEGETGYFTGSIPIALQPQTLINEDMESERLPVLMEQVRRDYPNMNENAINIGIAARFSQRQGHEGPVWARDIWAGSWA